MTLVVTGWRRLNNKDYRFAFSARICICTSVCTAWQYRKFIQTSEIWTNVILDHFACGAGKLSCMRLCNGAICSWACTFLLQRRSEGQSVSQSVQILCFYCCSAAMLLDERKVLAMSTKLSQAAEHRSQMTIYTAAGQRLAKFPVFLSFSRFACCWCVFIVFVSGKT